MAVPAGDRERLEHLIRYVLRPPVAQESLELTPEGKVLLRLRRPWSDGTRAILFEASELLERLAAMVPKPRINLLVYHGIFAPNESSASGVIEAMTSLGLNKKIALVGFDSSVFLLQSLRSGNIDGLIVQDPYRMGYLGVWTVVHHLEGYDVAPGGEKALSTGEHLVTKENLDDEATRRLFEPELQKKREIEVPAFEKK